MNCHCVQVRDTIANIERAWKGLIKAAPIPTSPLKGLEGSEVWITGPVARFKEHLRHVASRMGPRWYFLIVTDIDLMNAWLSYGEDIRDADVTQARNSSASDRFAALVDIAEPPELLIIRLGVKAARNKAMPEVLLETLQHRSHLDKATWICDQPSYPLAEGHICYDGRVAEHLEDWQRIRLEGVDDPVFEEGIEQMSGSTENRGAVPTLSQMFGEKKGKSK